MDSTQIILIWLIMGFGCGLIAVHKGYRTRVWFVLGVLLGPIALVIISIQKPQNTSGERASRPVSE